MKTIVIALGGNALIKPKQKGTIEDQMENLDKAMEHIVRLARKYNIILTHGNGPQVGNLLLQEEAAKSVPKMPLYVCVAETQGQIGYMIQEVLYNRLHALGIRKPVVTLITQVLVDPKDPAFRKPTKPIGPFYKSEKNLPKNWELAKTPFGYRRLVASPEPKKIIEENEIKKTYKEAIVIACGGGGVPVVERHGLKGIDAVIDKDLAAEKLAEIVDADMLVILTDVPCVYLNYKTKSQKPIRKMNISEAEQYLKSAQFPPGSMGPKIRAAVKFLQKGGKKAIITSFDLLEESLKGRAGTMIER
jgi:carbamate kinase